MTATPFTRLGLQLAAYAFPVPDAELFERVAEVARTAERVGFDSLWTMDHLHQIPRLGGREEPILEAYALLSALAVVTEQVRLGVLVGACGFRSPAVLAKMVTTIDIISSGRAILGVGAGWYEEEHVAYGLKFPSIGERLEQLSETVQVCRAMFVEHAPRFEGRQHRIDGARNVPAPIASQGPPIMLGGGGERVLIPMVARLADGCNFFGGPATVRHKHDVLERACAAVGRDPATITKTWLGWAVVTESEHEQHGALDRLGRILGVSSAAAAGLSLCGTREALAEQIAAYRAVGVDGFLVTMLDPYDLRQLEELGSALRKAIDA